MPSTAVARINCQPIAPEAPSEIETKIGRAMVDAARALAFAMAEYNDGGLQYATKMQGGEMIARLYVLKQSLDGEVDFNHLARLHGVRALRKHCSEINVPTAAFLVDGVLEWLAALTQAEAN